MSKATPKLWITNSYTNHISYRRLNSFELLNPKNFALSHSAHDSWDAAHSHMVGERVRQVVRVTATLSSAVRSLDRARAMVKPDGKKDVVVVTAKALEQ